MTELIYISSDGKRYNLQSERIQLLNSNLHQHAWKANSVRVGGNRYRHSFEKEPYVYEIDMAIRGSTQEKRQILNELFDSMEHDIVTKTAGTIWLGKSYIKGFFIETESGAYSKKTCWAELKATLFCPNPAWITEEVIQLLPQSKPLNEHGKLTFPFDFPFGFGAPTSGTVNTAVEHYSASDFKMAVFGPCVDPTISINKHPYTIHTTLLENEYLEIDSRAHTIFKHDNNGGQENLYNSRSFKHSVFKKIPCGGLDIVWNGTFGADITLYLERSEPKW